MDDTKIHDLERRIQQLENAMQYMAMPSQQLEVTTENPTANVMMNQVAGVQANVMLHQNYGFWSRPLTGAMHTVVNIGGAAGRGISIASTDERYRPKTLLQGDCFMGDNTGQYVWLTAGTTLNIVTNATVNITAPQVNVHASTQLNITCPDVEMSGNLTVQGDILDKSGSQANNMRAMRTLYDAHTHGGIQTGSGRTSIPDHQE
jgi:phage gp45-like